MSRKSQPVVRMIARFLPGFLLVAPLVTAYGADQAATQAPAAHSSPHHKVHKKPAPMVLPPLPAGPLRQLPMDQIPAAAPTVTYENGALRIEAENATLGEILRKVQKLTGASIDTPPGGANERVVVQIGPGAPRDVLATLLNGTSYNYVMLGSATDPIAVASVMITQKASVGGVQTAVNTPAPAFEQGNTPVAPHVPMPFRERLIDRRNALNQNQPPAAAAAADAEDKDDDADDDKDDKDDDSDQAAQPVTPGQPVVPPGAMNPEQGNDPNQPNAGPKTPEQLLQIMRQGQQQNGQPVPPGNVPPQ
jgi:hypothetical protein